jgi:insertion element IS1 protein InsB
VTIQKVEVDEMTERGAPSHGAYPIEVFESYVGKKLYQRWLWHAIDHQTGTILAFVLGRRQDRMFLKLKKLLKPFGITN